MVSARQEIDLRPQLERLDALILRSAGLDPAALSFEFRPLWQLSAAEKASVALQKAQASQVYAGLGLWPSKTTARLVEAQLVEDGIYPSAEAIFAEAGAAVPAPEGGNGAVVPGHVAPLPLVVDFDPDQPRDPDGRWSGGGSSSVPAVPISAGPVDPAGGVSMPPHAASHSAQAGFAAAAQGPHAPDGTPIELAASADDPQGLKMAKAAAAAAGLDRRQRRIFHDAITGQGITDYQELLSIALSVKKGEYP